MNRLDARLTIVQVTSSSNRSGGTRQASLLTRGLLERGHRVVFCAPPGSPALRWAEAAGAEPRALGFGGLPGQWRASRRLRQIVRDTGAQVVHAHHTKGHNVALLATFGGGFPPVVANRGVVFRPEFPAKFRSRRTAAVITNSRTVKGVLTACGVPDRKVHVVYNAKELPDLDGLRARVPALRRELGVGDGPVVGAVGSGRPEKGFRFLVEAAPLILEGHPGAVFVLVGDSTEPLLPRIRELGLAERFRLTGHRPDAAELMAVFDVFVLPSVDMESCPNVVLEAMAAERPVVGADVGGVGEILSHGVCGLVVPPGRARELGEAVNRVLSAPERARRMGLEGRRRVGERFSVAAKVEATLEVYREVLGLPGAADRGIRIGRAG